MTIVLLEEIIVFSAIYLPNWLEFGNRKLQKLFADLCHRKNAFFLLFFLLLLKLEMNLRLKFLFGTWVLFIETSHWTLTLSAPQSSMELIWRLLSMDGARVATHGTLKLLLKVYTVKMMVINYDCNSLAITQPICIEKHLTINN